jgi:hypothetical protein
MSRAGIAAALLAMAGALVGGAGATGSAAGVAAGSPAPAATNISGVPWQAHGTFGPTLFGLLNPAARVPVLLQNPATGATVRVQMLIDTGSTITTIDRATAQALGLTPTGRSEECGVNRCASVPQYGPMVVESSSGQPLWDVATVWSNSSSVSQASLGVNALGAPGVSFVTSGRAWTLTVAPAPAPVVVEWPLQHVQGTSFGVSVPVPSGAGESVTPTGETWTWSAFGGGQVSVAVVSRLALHGVPGPFPSSTVETYARTACPAGWTGEAPACFTQTLRAIVPGHGGIAMTLSLPAKSYGTDNGGNLAYRYWQHVVLQEPPTDWPRRQLTRLGVTVSAPVWSPVSAWGWGPGWAWTGEGGGYVGVTIWRGHALPLPTGRYDHWTKGPWPHSWVMWYPGQDFCPGSDSKNDLCNELIARIQETSAVAVTLFVGDYRNALIPRILRAVSLRY